MSPRSVVLLLTLSLTTSTIRAHAQNEMPRPGLLIINGLIGGATAAITASIQQRPIRRAVILGAIGGATVFAGKCFIGNSRPLTDWIGHQTVAVGSSIVANASMGRGAFDRIVVPLGPVRFYYDTKQRRTRIRLDLFEAGVAAYYARKPNTSVDWTLSAKHDALILFDKAAPTNFEVGGVIKTWSRAPSLLDHELIHVAQDQFVSTAWEDPLEEWAIPMLPGGKWVNRYFGVGILAPVWALANAAIPGFDRPWEREATAVEARC